MEQMIASWSVVMVHGLMVADAGFEPYLARLWGPEADEEPGAFGTVNQMCDRSGGYDGPSGNRNA